MESRETNNLEYKINMKNTFLKTVSAYANYGNGKILFGVNDDGIVVGLDDIIDKALDLENRINDSIEPIPSYKIEINEKDRIIILRVEEGIHKPYYYKNKAYKRSDSSTVEVDRVELNRLILENINRNFEDLPAENQDLTFNYLKKSLIENLNIQKMNLDILKTLNLYSDKLGYNKAAELLSDDNIYPMIDIARFGESIDIFLNRERIENKSLLKAFNRALEIFRDNYTYEVIDESTRKKIEKIPEKAFREALANGIVHRTWDLNSSVRISMFKDKIEITSPGGLPAGLSEMEYLKGQISILRNPILANIFYRLNYIEQFGTGIRRINYAYEPSLVKPEYKLLENTITVILPVYVESLEFLGEEEQLIYQILRENKEMSRSEVESKSGFSKYRILRILNKLIDENMIEKIGKSVNTKYKIL